MLLRVAQLRVGLYRPVPKLAGIGLAQVVPALHFIAIVADVDVVSLPKDRPAFIVVHYGSMLFIFLNFENFYTAVLYREDEGVGVGVFLIGQALVLFPGAGGEAPENPLAVIGASDEDGVGYIMAGSVKCGCLELVLTCAEYFLSCGYAPEILFLLYDLEKFIYKGFCF